MKLQNLHSWNVSPTEAKRIQEELRQQVQLSDSIDLDQITRIAGVDNAYVRQGAESTAHAVVAVFTFPALEVIETAFGSCPVTFPYIPGLLTFREAPAVLEAFRQITAEPDVVLFDGQGYAHFRRMGLASHLGVILDRPTIGCAKTRLVGHYEEPADEFGAYTPLVDRGEEVGAAVRTRPSHTPLFVSPGNRISIETAVAVVLACCRNNHFMPEPTSIAHNLVTQQAHPQR
jgi:deoxyribonuclease V